MTDTSMLKFQYGQMLDQLILLQLHAEDPNCPCSLTGVKQGELGEYCEPKHLRAVVALARETISMDEDEARVDYLEGLVLAGTELLVKMEAILCGKEVDLGEYATWARDKRKPLEELCYSSFCELVPATELAEYIRDEEIIRLFAEPRWCFGVKEVNKSLGRLAKDLGIARSKAMGLKKKLEMPISICKGQAEMFVSPIAVLDPYGSRCRDPETGQWLPSEECGFEPAGITTSALGMDGLTRYDFEFRVVSLDKLIVSHDPFTFTPNSEYPKELQPRLRERAATKIQVEKIAANLEPDAVLTDFHTLDRGAPIIGPDRVVEAGNGRVMGIMRATRDFPDKYDEYRARLKERAADFGLRVKDVDSISIPILVRVRITDVDRAAFTQEANSAATIAPSAIENARIDAQKITTGMLQELVVGENQSLEDALRSPRNKEFANRFLKTLPENIQASLVDAHGYLNRDGVHRMAMAVFVSAFQGDTGLRLAEKAFESIDMDVRNSINAIARSLGLLARAEALIRSGDRDTNLSIGDDLAQVVTVYSAIKRTSELTVEKYLAQGQLLERELTDFEEKVLIVFEKHRRSPKKLGAVLSAYSQKVIDSPPPAQVTMLPGAVITKEELWESAVKAGEAQPMLVEGEATMKELEDYLKEAEMADGLGSAVITGLGIGTGFKIIDELAKYIKGKDAEMAGNPIGKFTPAECKHIGSALNHLTQASREVTDLISNKRLWSDEEVHSYHWDAYHDIERASNRLDYHMEHFCSAAVSLEAMKLLTKEIRDKLPPLYSQEKVQDPIVQVKFFTPDSNWTWYGIEFDGEDRFFGWVVGFEQELGYFSLKELESARGPLGLSIERDKWFTPQPLSEVKKLHQRERGQMANESSSAGFSLDPRQEKTEDIDRFYDWTDKASTDEVLGELCERADYLGAHLCIAKEGNEVDREWTGKCPYIGTEDVYRELGRLRFLCWKLTQKLPSSVTIIGGKEAAVTDKAIRTKFMETAKDAVENALAKLDEVVKVGWEEKLAGDERAILDRLLGVWTGLTEDLRTIYLLMGIKLKEEAPYATQIPKDVVVFKTTIEKHYRPVGDFHKGSIRIVKPKANILVTLGCLKKDKWDAKTATCLPNPTVLTTVVPNNKTYMDELEHLKLVHPEVKVKYRTKEVGVEPKVNEDRQEELAAIDKALENVEVVG